MNEIQLVMVVLDDMKVMVYLVIEDVSGDLAILEYVEGKLVVYYGLEYWVMMNDFIYD